jgi:arylsulfatase A-like enzyme
MQISMPGSASRRRSGSEESLLLVESPVQIGSTKSIAPKLRPGLALTSMLSIICLSLEVESLEKLDSLSLYMSYRQIVLDIGVALIALLGFSVAWWCLMLVSVKLTEVALGPSKKQYGIALCWYLGLGIPLSYLVLDIFGAMRLELFSRWHPELVGWILVSLLLIGGSVGGLCLVSLPRLQEFCRTRLTPIAWAHIFLGLFALLFLWMHGVYLFRDYAHQGRTAAASDSPDVYLISIDAARADDLSLYGYSRPTTPNLERFSHRAYTFDYFFANSNFTTPTTTSIETGQLPWTHRVFQAGGFTSVQAEGETIASLLHQRGYYTAMISSNYLATPVRHRTLNSYDAVEFAAPIDGSGPWLRITNLVGTNAQYTLFASLLQSLAGIRFYLDSLVWGNYYPYPAEPVFDRARSLLERHDIDQPRFVWTHVFPPHDPYLAPPPFRMRFLPSNKLTHVYDYIGFRGTMLPRGATVSDLQARYDEMILYADHVVGDYLDWLDRTGRLDRSIVIVTADHGESFEHNWMMHTGPYLFNSLVRIPLLVHLPGQKQGARVGQVAQQADLLPTVLDLLGITQPSWTDGISLRPALEGRELPQRAVYSMNLERNRVWDRISKGTVAIIDNEFKYVDYLDAQKESLYRYRTDQYERNDLVDSERDVAARMRTALLDKLREVNQRPLPKP